MGMYKSKAVQINPPTKHTRAHFHISSRGVEGTSSRYTGMNSVLSKALDIFATTSSSLEATESHSNSNSVTETLILYRS